MDEFEWIASIACRRIRIGPQLSWIRVGYNSSMNDMHERPGAEFWTVWRIDDNANVFVVREHLDREEAEHVVAEFTARGHKQMYWAEREAERQRTHPDGPV